MRLRAFIIPACLVIMLACALNSVSGDDTEKAKPFDSPFKAKKSEKIELTSPVFEYGEPIPILFTCDGADASPPLEWDRIPEGTVSFALFCDDPDAPNGNWVHWVIYNISPDSTSLPQGLPRKEILNNGARQGISDFNVPGYGGPCPPSGVHRYFFLLYALDTDLEFEKPPQKFEVEKATMGHVLGKGLLMGTYSRE
jgi:Raf kinase inhibitor-like YbhB/YbcL family protein